MRIITILFYLALTHLPKFKRGQGQISAILLAIKFLTTIFKEFLTNSPEANIAYLAILDNFSRVPFFLIRTPLMQNNFIKKLNLFGLYDQSIKPIKLYSLSYMIHVKHEAAVHTK